MPRLTAGKGWKQIVGDLSNPVRQDIVADDREETTVLVHRIVYARQAVSENTLKARAKD